jgi:hypothetical protein
MRLLYQFGPGFERIAPVALWADIRLGLGYLRLLDGCAVVSDVEWIRKPTRSIGSWMRSQSDRCRKTLMKSLFTVRAPQHQDLC